MSEPVRWHEETRSRLLKAYALARIRWPGPFSNAEPTIAKCLMKFRFRHRFVHCAPVLPCAVRYDPYATSYSSDGACGFQPSESAQWRKQAAPRLRQYRVLVRVAPSLVPQLALRYGEEIEEQVEQAAPPDLAGWIRLTFTFETEEVAWSHILSFGSLIEVLEPPDLRKKIAQTAATLLTLYQQQHPE